MNLTAKQQRIQDHYEKMEEQREAQMRGEIKFLQASEDSDSQIREDEQNMFHVELKMIDFIQATQTTEETVNIATFDQETWKRIKGTATIQGYHRQRILHDPTKAKKADSKNQITKEDIKKVQTEGIREEYEKITGKKPGNKKTETLIMELQDIKAEKEKGSEE